MLIAYGFEGDNIVCKDTTTNKSKVISKSDTDTLSKVSNIKLFRGEIKGKGYTIDRLGKLDKSGRPYKNKYFILYKIKEDTYKVITTEGRIISLSDSELTRQFWQGKGVNYRVRDKGIEIQGEEYKVENKYARVTKYDNEDYIELHKKYTELGIAGGETTLQKQLDSRLLWRWHAESKLYKFIECHKYISKLMQLSDNIEIEILSNAVQISDNETVNNIGDKTIYKLRIVIGDIVRNVLVPKEDKRLLQIAKISNHVVHKPTVQTYIGLVRYSKEDISDMDISVTSYQTINDMLGHKNKEVMDIESKIEEIKGIKISKSGYMYIGEDSYSLRNDMQICNNGIVLAYNKLEQCGRLK